MDLPLNERLMLIERVEQRKLLTFPPLTRAPKSAGRKKIDEASGAKSINKLSAEQMTNFNSSKRENNENISRFLSLSLPRTARSISHA